MPICIVAPSGINSAMWLAIFWLMASRLGSFTEACSRISRRMARLRSSSSLKRPQMAWSSGIGLFRIQVPQAYW